MRPLFHRVEAELSRVLGAEIKYDVQDLLVGTGIERADVLTKLIYSGVLNINEARALLNYGETTNGNAFGVPASQMPLDQWVQPKTEGTVSVG